MKNQYPGRCVCCNNWVATGKGELARDESTGTWVVTCVRCPEANTDDGPEPSTIGAGTRFARPVVRPPRTPTPDPPGVKVWRCVLCGQRADPECPRHPDAARVKR